MRRSVGGCGAAGQDRASQRAAGHCGKFLAADQGARKRRIEANGLPETQAYPAQEQQHNASLGGLRRNQRRQRHRQLHD